MDQQVSMKKPVECRPGCQCKKGYSKSTMQYITPYVFVFVVLFFFKFFGIEMANVIFQTFSNFHLSQLVYDPTSKTCIKPSECPCHHAGRSYSENNRITQDCNTWSVVYLLFSLVDLT